MTATKRSNLFVKCLCWCSILISYALCASIWPNGGSIIFPDQLEKFEAKISYDDEDDADVPILEPSMSENEAEQFLNEFGFNTIESTIGLRFSGGPNAKILLYQQRHGLNETGELDRETKISLRTPKCGVSTVAAHGEDFRWSATNLSYYVRNTPTGIPSITVKQLLGNAFHQWSRVTNLDFFESDDPKADIEIVFGNRAHESRGKKCRNTLGDTTLAHSFYPTTGAIHFNTKFYSRVMNNEEFFTTAMHEIGHAIGLEHSVSKASLMYPTPVAQYSEIPEHDIEKIQHMYGKRSRLETNRAPVLCELSKYDAVMFGERGQLHIVAGKYCFTSFQPDEDPDLIIDKWPGAPDTLDDAVTIGFKTFIFKGVHVWAFKRNQLVPGYPRQIRHSFPGLPKNLDALAYENQKYLYAFKNDHYWRYNTRTRSVDLSDEVEDFGVTGRIDAAAFSNDKLFLFKDNVRYAFDFSTQTSSRYDSNLFNC